MTLNYDKTKEMRICFKKKTSYIPPISINERQIEQVNCTRLLGVAISHDLTWQLHINEITTKASRRLNFVKIYSTIISPSSSTPDRCGIRAYKKQVIQLDNIQKRAMCIIFREISYSNAIATAILSTLADRREALCRSLFASMQQPNHKLHHLLPPQGHVITQSLMFVLTVFLAIGPIDSSTLFCRMDLITGSNRTFLIIIYEYYLPLTVKVFLAIYSVDLF